MFSLLWLIHFCVSNIKAVKEKKTELIFWSQSVLKNALLKRKKNCGTLFRFSIEAPGHIISEEAPENYNQWLV